MVSVNNPIDLNSLFFGPVQNPSITIEDIEKDLSF